jgi:hypothetical protein
MTRTPRIINIKVTAELVPGWAERDLATLELQQAKRNCEQISAKDAADRAQDAADVADLAECKAACRGRHPAGKDLIVPIRTAESVRACWTTDGLLVWFSAGGHDQCVRFDETGMRALRDGLS